MRLGKRGGFRSICSTGACGCMLHTNNLSFNLAKINLRVNLRLNFKWEKAVCGLIYYKKGGMWICGLDFFFLNLRPGTLRT